MVGCCPPFLEFVWGMDGSTTTLYKQNADDETAPLADIVYGAAIPRKNSPPTRFCCRRPKGEASEVWWRRIKAASHISRLIHSEDSTEFFPSSSHHYFYTSEVACTTENHVYKVIVKTKGQHTLVEYSAEDRLVSQAKTSNGRVLLLSVGLAPPAY